MADVTGRVYEAFVEHLLREAGLRDEFSPGTSPQYLYEKHREAACYKSTAICSHAHECSAVSMANSIPYGPWYDPDFFILKSAIPAACIHVTHWSNPRDSKRKFWRTIEDHFQYKTQFGPDFLSINVVFEGTSPGTAPRLLRDTLAKHPLHGWDPAIASVLVSSFDASIVFPRHYEILSKFARAVPADLPSSSRARRQTFNQTWTALRAKDRSVDAELDLCVNLLKKALKLAPHPRYSTQVIQKLQDECFRGRKRASGAKPTLSRYRKGIQHAFILREVLGVLLGSDINVDACLRRVLSSNPRFQTNKFRDLLGLPESISLAKCQNVFDVLAGIPVRIEKGTPHLLLVKSAGIGHSAWDSDFSYFIQTLQSLDAAASKQFFEALLELFLVYRSAQGISDVTHDLAEPTRVKGKVNYVFRNYVGLKEKLKFTKRLTEDLLTPGESPPHQAVANDVHNWVLDGILTAFGLGSVQEINNRMFDLFEATYGENLKFYAYQGNYLLGYLISGVDIGPLIHRNAKFNRDEFYRRIWPVISECLWEAIQGVTPRTKAETEFYYRHGKAGRIISSSDLEPIRFLFRRELPVITDAPRLRGCFNQLSTQRGWGSSALTTDVSGEDLRTGSMIQTQTVTGKKHIADKTRELAARRRSLHITCDSDGSFQPSKDRTKHFLVLDGDWPLESKINLYESGFDGIFEIGELSHLARTLDRLVEGKLPGQRSVVS